MNCLNSNAVKSTQRGRTQINFKTMMMKKTRTESKREKEKALLRSRFSNRNSRSKAIGVNKK